MIINEMAGSGGDLMPYMFRAARSARSSASARGAVSCTRPTRRRFVDGGSMIAPRGGFFTRDGKWAVENEGVAPDIDVENWPKDVIAGHDPQLERAVAGSDAAAQGEAGRADDEGTAAADVGQAHGRWWGRRRGTRPLNAVRISVQNVH